MCSNRARTGPSIRCGCARAPPRLAIDGNLGPNRTLDLEFSIDADNLGLLAEDARGTLHARGRISGSAGAPLIKLNAQGADIEHGDVKMDKLAANVDVDWRGQRASHADIAISRLTVDQHALTQFNAVLDGTTAEHAFKLDALAATTSLHLSGKGSFVDKVWNSTIADLMIDDTANLNLRLEAPVAITASAQAFKLGALCLHGKVAQLCGEGAWNPSAWNATRRCAQPADRHADGGPHSQGRVPGHGERHRPPQRQRRCALRRRCACRPGGRGHPPQARQRAHRRDQLRLGIS